MKRKILSTIFLSESPPCSAGGVHLGQVLLGSFAPEIWSPFGSFLGPICQMGGRIFSAVQVVFAQVESVGRFERSAAGVVRLRAPPSFHHPRQAFQIPTTRTRRFRASHRDCTLGFLQIHLELIWCRWMQLRLKCWSLQKKKPLIVWQTDLVCSTFQRLMSLLKYLKVCPDYHFDQMVNLQITLSPTSISREASRWVGQGRRRTRENGRIWGEVEGRRGQ